MGIQSSKVYLPFTIAIAPIKKLSLINFENDPDEIYNSLELQYINGEPYGIGWRVIAYRNDKYVDVYDSKSLTAKKDETFDVTQKGLNKHVQVAMNHTYFEKDRDGIHIGFEFNDIENRVISVQIDEHNRRSSKYVDLLAPIGHGTEKPTFLPLFFMYKFDFVRKAGTNISIQIDGKKRVPDKFPVPMPKEMQFRYFARYSMDCQIIEFARAEKGTLEQYEFTQDHKIIFNNTEYVLEKKEDMILLNKIVIRDKDHPIHITFSDSIPVYFNNGISYSNQNDIHFESDFIINAGTSMGAISGKSSFQLKDKIMYYTLIPTEGWSSVPNSFLTRMMLGKDTLFCTWPKTYKYQLQINVNNGESESSWIRI